MKFSTDPMIDWASIEKNSFIKNYWQTLSLQNKEEKAKAGWENSVPANKGLLNQ